MFVLGLALCVAVVACILATELGRWTGLVATAAIAHALAWAVLGSI